MDFEPMTPEDIERTVQFLLRQQAQFAADFDKLAGKTDRIAEGLIGLTGLVGRVATAQEETDRAFREADARLAQRIDATAEQLRATDEHIRTTEAHLNILIEMFERHLRDSRGERPS